MTDCGESFDITEGTPTENHMRFCCYCGKPLASMSLVYDATNDEYIYAEQEPM